MGAYAGPDVSESGLVLALDGANLKSFKGEPTTNLITDPLALSGLPSPFTYNAYEATAERTDQLPNSEMKKISPYWIKLVKTSSTNGRAIVYGQSGFTTGVDYCRSFYIYSEDTNLSSVNWNTDNGAVVSIQSYTEYGPSDLGKVKRIQTIFRSISGSTADVLRIGDTDPIGTTIWVTGIQIEQKSYPTTVVNGTRGDTVATGGGWADMSGNGNHGQLVNGVRESSDNLGALVFSGDDEYVNLGSFFNYQTFTIELWVNPGTTQTAYADIFDNNHTAYQNFVLQQSSTNLNQYSFGVSDSSGNISSTGTIILTANTWTHLAFTFSPSTRVIAYVNGTFYSQGNLANGRTINYVSPNLSLGRWSWGNSRFWKGNISNFKTYNRILTASEIQQNFNATRGRYGV